MAALHFLPGRKTETVRVEISLKITHLCKLALKSKSSYKDLFFLFCHFGECEISLGKLGMSSLIFHKCIVHVSLRLKFSL